jgi:hypothetical protein
LSAIPDNNLIGFSRNGQLVALIDPDENTVVLDNSGRPALRVIVPPLPPGAVSIVAAVVDNLTGIISDASAPLNFTVTASNVTTPQLASVSPGEGRPRDQITINGTGFSTALTENAVVFRQGLQRSEARVLRASATQLTVEVPSQNIERGPATIVVRRIAESGASSANSNALDFNMYERLGTPAPGERRQVNPDLLVNAQKGFELIDEVWSLGIGTQAGVNPARQSRQVRFQNFTWGVSELTLTEGGLKAYVGAYYANTAYAGPGARGGFMLGTAVPIIKDKVHFQADFISGRRDISVGVVGAVFFLPNKWQLSLGAQLPAPRSGNPYGAVIELTLPGYPLFARNRP